MIWFNINLHPGGAENGYELCMHGPWSVCIKLHLGLPKEFMNLNRFEYMKANVYSQTVNEIFFSRVYSAAKKYFKVLQTVLLNCVYSLFIEKFSWSEMTEKIQWIPVNHMAAGYNWLFLTIYNWAIGIMIQLQDGKISVSLLYNWVDFSCLLPTPDISNLTLSQYSDIHRIYPCSQKKKINLFCAYIHTILLSCMSNRRICVRICNVLHWHKMLIIPLIFFNSERPWKSNLTFWLGRCQVFSQFFVQSKSFPSKHVYQILYIFLWQLITAEYYANESNWTKRNLFYTLYIYNIGEVFEKKKKVGGSLATSC